MILTQEALDHLRSILNAFFPGWSGFSDPRFIAEEVDYKRAAIEKASTRLSRTALEDLIQRGQFTEVVQRLEKIGQATNLLYLGHPSQGDLNILYDQALDEEQFATRILELLHGEGPSPERLERYERWVDSRGLPNKWTFPTYFLFLLHPDRDVFVKPRSVQRFLELVGSDVRLGSNPSGEVYAHLLELAGEIRTRLSDGEAGDMVDVQSVIWIAGRRGHDMGVQELDEDKERILRRLLEEFGTSYVETEAGRTHLTVYPDIREQARQNFAQVQAAAESGEDVTDLVLTKLLPHSDTQSNRARGAWIHVAPAVAGNIRTWFENVGWVDEEDWPRISRTILGFVEQVVEDPDSLESACEDFSGSEYSKGFQTGMLTPILSALVPEQLILINNKSRAVVNHFLGLDHTPKIEDYPELNTAAHYLINRIRPQLDELLPEGVTALEGFDAFTHWLVSEKGYRFGRSQAWKIKVDDLAEWSRWTERGYVGVTAPSLGDVSSIKKKEWERERARVVEGRTPDTGGADPDEVWILANEVQEGDEILVTLGTERALGIGMVVGPYEYDETPPQHRIPVEWQDTEPRAISEPAWRKRFHEIEAKQVDKVRALPPIGDGDAAFTRQAFELLAGLHEHPRRDFYQERQDEFKAHVEEPLQELLTSVAALLPPPMKEVLETEKRLFSRIPKNDYGRGGAWDFYWGAFYPRGGKRIDSAQLYVVIQRDRFEYGFSLGEYATDHLDRFLTNVRRRRESIAAALAPHLDTSGLVFGMIQDGSEIVEPGRSDISIDAWLKDLSAGEVSVRTILSAEEVLSTPQADLRAQILDTFRQLFPLILLATSDDPLTAISEYWGSDDVGDDIQPEYPLEECAEVTGFEVSLLRDWVGALERKGQAIFYGPPGTGKTFMAEHIARHVVGGGDGFIDLVQFHPAYAYEDFIQGIRPITRADGSLEYQMVPGRFLEVCRKAQNRSGPCVLIIDEINRANLSRVFGELMYLLEYRDEEIPLAGGGNRFRIPKNLRILGTMNTADRSIALVDHALRRRFAFIPLRPQFGVLEAFHQDAGRSVASLVEKLNEINRTIGDPNYHLGITFFMVEKLDDHLEAIWKMEIEPYLEEYFFDDAQAVARFRWDRVGEELLA